MCAFNGTREMRPRRRTVSRVPARGPLRKVPGRCAGPSKPLRAKVADESLNEPGPTSKETYAHANLGPRFSHLESLGNSRSWRVGPPGSWSSTLPGRKPDAESCDSCVVVLRTAGGAKLLENKGGVLAMARRNAWGCAGTQGGGSARPR